MTTDVEDLLADIERLRERIHELVADPGDLQDPVILRLSRELDRLLNEYERALRAKRRCKP